MHISYTCSPLTAHCAPSSPRAAARPSSRPRLLRPVAVFGAPLALNPNHPVGGGKPGGVHSHLPRWRGGELGDQLSSAQPSRFFFCLLCPACARSRHSRGPQKAQHWLYSPHTRGKRHAIAPLTCIYRPLRRERLALACEEARRRMEWWMAHHHHVFSSLAAFTGVVCTRLNCSVAS